MREVLTGLAKRRLVDVAAARFAEEPVLVLNGPRTVGKSTLLSQLAERLGRTVIDCDDPATRSAVRADPGRFIESDQPVLIDEYQHVPEILDAIKAQLNRDLRPGRYVLAGSTRYASVPAAAQALTGRVDIIPVLPLTQGEIDGVPETFVAKILDGSGIELPPSQLPATTRDEYARRSTPGGMPVALRRAPGSSRSRWFANYIDLVIDKDVMDISRVRQREMLPRLLSQLAARSGQVLNISPAAGAIGLDRSTAENYVQLLEAVFLIYRLPAWGTTLGSRTIKHPKVHMTDSGVLAWLLNLTPQKIAQAAPATLTEYGHLLETFAVGEILKQVSWSDAPVSAGYFRTEAGEEVDLVLERDDGQVIAFEIKAGTRISSEDLRGIRLLKDRLGSRLEEAVILYTGEHAYQHDGYIWILPLSELWRH
ncbi:MAG TPA: ATP-binding protein [Streptosporangiaceae bacterium]|nr:ATP-binding protein [Streptosporangiaceae bacterium]